MANAVATDLLHGVDCKPSELFSAEPHRLIWIRDLLAAQFDAERSVLVYNSVNLVRVRLLAVVVGLAPSAAAAYAFLLDDSSGIVEARVCPALDRVITHQSMRG